MNPNIEKLIFATGALVFAVIALVTVIAFGDEFSRAIAVWSAFIACLSQFVAQERHPVAQRVSIAIAYIAFALMFMALIYFTKGG
jgi:hypothetical protein